ncbi:MAG: hypothetical protein E7289_08020 [Lachnospiraceae bacterium]|nr:hypothetical protein [Lachnospiraceae bacterium]
MDKYEYRIRAEEINDLIERKEYVEAVKIADTIDWRRVRSVVMLCKVSELYKINRRYEDSKEVLLLAYELQNKSRKIIYSLCELSIKLEETVQAVEYYKEFIKVAPRDTGRFILQYRLYEAQDVSLEERIAVLEEYKKRDYREKWAYELAYLYHRIGLATRCIEECDELILWFGEGKYVIKALELKMLHAPLTPEQQEKYNARFMVPAPEVTEEPAEEEQVQEEVEPSLSIEIKSVEATRAKTAEIPSKKVKEEIEDTEPSYTYEVAEEPVFETAEPDMYGENYPETSQEEISEEIPTDEIPDEDADMKIVASDDDFDIQVKTIDVGDEYNTINLQDELAKSLAEMFAQEDMEASDATRALPIESIFEATSQNITVEPTREIPEIEEIEVVEEEAPETEEIAEVEEEVPETEEIAEVEEEVPETEEIAEVEEVPETEEIEEVEEEVVVPVEEIHEIEEISQENPEEELMEEESIPEVEPIVFHQNQPLSEAFIQAVQNAAMEAAKEAAKQAAAQAATEAAAEAAKQAAQATAEAMKEMKPEVQAAEVSAEDIQVPEAEPVTAEEPEEMVEKQITGQLSFSDIMAEWEETKKANEEKHLQEMKQRVMEQTGPLLSDFDAAARASVQSDLDMLSPMLDVFSDTDDLATEVEEALKEDTTEPAEEEIPVAEETPIEEDVLLVEEELTVEEIPVVEEEPAEEETVEVEETPAEEQISVTEDMSLEDRPSSFNTEEINGLEEKLMGALSDQHYDTANIQASVLENEMTKQEEPAPVVEEQIPVGPRTLTKEEKDLFGCIAPSKELQEKVAEVLDRASLLPYTGNIIITGEKETGALETAKNIVLHLSKSNRSFSGKTKVFSSEEFTGKDIFAIVNELPNGALIIENAGDMSADLCNKLIKAGNEMDNGGILYILVDTKSGIERLGRSYSKIMEYFNLSIDISALDNDRLVKFGKAYAREKEYSIDDMGVLALYNRIEERQTNEHAVTVDEVKEMIHQAIDKAEKKSISHFMDVIFAKRYDKDDMIVLREKDFIND